MNWPEIEKIFSELTEEQRDIMERVFRKELSKAIKEVAEGEGE